MQDGLKGIVIGLCLVGGGLSAVILARYGTLSPCGIVRAEVRAEGAREGGFASVATILPDAVIDGLLEGQFGPLNPLRCVALAFAGPPPARRPISRPQPPPTMISLKQANQEARKAIAECREQRITGALPSYAASAQCSNPLIIGAYRRARYRYMDLIYQLMAQRLSVARQIDDGSLTEQEATAQLNAATKNIDEEARQRALNGQ